jgi:lipoate-protein ligase A
MLLKKVRFIPFSNYSPYENMAIDEYLISYYEKTGVPVLRFYSWRPAGISVGRNQDAGADINLAKCKKDSVPVVRRLTGGGAIYHRRELTYSIACSETDISKPGATVKESFEDLNRFILNMYSKFGLAAAYSKEIFSGERPHGLRHGFCFAGNEEYDIIINGKKIGGNAQHRKKNIIFQHGSIPLEENREAGDYFKCEVKEGNYTYLNLMLGREITSGEAAANLAAAFIETFGTDLVEEQLDMEEKRQVVGLLTEKYAVDNWNLRK